MSIDGSTAGLQILLVDDDENCRESLRSFLSSDGHSIYTARHGFEAVDFARRCRHEKRRLDLSILDYRMPELSGIETFERLLVELPQTDAIFISGEASRMLEDLVASAGGFALIEKPVKLPRVRRVLERFCRERLDQR